MEKKRIIAVVSLIVLAAFAAGWFLKGTNVPRSQPDLIIDTADKNAVEADKQQTPSDQSLLWVYVVGEVKQPGVYQLPAGSRVFQAVELAEAGDKADLTQLDMARVLVDGEKVRVPKTGEKLAPEPSGMVAPENRSAAVGSGLVNINTASVQELDRELPGIGPSLAQRIVDYRSQHPFAKKEDIKEVSGIGDKRYESIKDLITVSQ